MSEQNTNYPFQVVAEIIKGLAWPMAALMIFFSLKLPITGWISTLSHKPVPEKEHTRVEVKNVFMEKEWTRVQKRSPKPVFVARKVEVKKLKHVPSKKQETLNRELEILSQKLDSLTKKLMEFKKHSRKRLLNKNR